MTNREFVLKAMRDTYGLMEVSGEVSRMSALFVEIMAKELDRRDALHPLPAEDAVAYADAMRTIALIKAKNGMIE